MAEKLEENEYNNILFRLLEPKRKINALKDEENIRNNELGKVKYLKQTNLTTKKMIAALII